MNELNEFILGFKEKLKICPQCGSDNVRVYFRNNRGRRGQVLCRNCSYYAEHLIDDKTMEVSIVIEFINGETKRYWKNHLRER